MDSFPTPVPKKRRIPKACASCRTSKLKCDGGKPCTRCRVTDIYCDYVKPPSDPLTEKLRDLEAEISSLRQQISVPPPEPGIGAVVALLELQQQQQQQQQNPSMNDDTRIYSHPFQQVCSPVSQTSGIQGDGSEFLPRISSQPLPFKPAENVHPHVGTKRRRGDFEINIEENLDVVNKGLISYTEAELYFETFFKGCDKYVPVFDPSFDTFESVRHRSSMLFDVILAIGCRASCGPGSSHHLLLTNATKSALCSVLLSTPTFPPSIETIQALLINACYSEKGWLLTSMAVKMALNLNLPGSYQRLCELVLDESERGDGRDSLDREEEGGLMRESRVWFGVFILEHILSLDCGKKPGIKAISTDEVRRCRVLLQHPARTALDFRLLAQVELNTIRALAHERLSPTTGSTLSDEEMGEIVRGTRIDLSVWLSDWINLVESTVPKEEDRASLIVNLRIQRDWAEMTMLCKGLQGIGIDNVAIMSDSQRNLIHLAKVSAQRHLSIIIANPKLYLATFRYGMDFVWAKCAFSVLLLLKLTRLLPSSTDMSTLISDAKILLGELSKVRGSSNIYFRILCLSVEKCEKALNGDSSQHSGGLNEVDAEMDFQSYVPKEFILEWNFPGLTFCWIPFDFQDLFLDFGAGF